MKLKVAVIASIMYLTYIPFSLSQVIIPDFSFGNNGVLKNDSTFAYAATIDQNNNTYFGGIFTYSSTADLAVTKLLPSYQHDVTFGQNGVARFDLGFNQQRILDLAVQTDGKIVVVGELLPSSNNFDGFIARLNTDGLLDSTFNSVGYAIINVNNLYDSFSTVAIQSDGKIVVGGASGSGGQFDYKIAAWRFNTNGTPDLTFAINGVYLNTENGGVSKVLIDGTKIVLAGHMEAPNNRNCIIRLDSYGLHDGSFGFFGEYVMAAAGSNFVTDIIDDGAGYIFSTMSYSGNVLSTDISTQYFKINNSGVLDNAAFGSGSATVTKTGYAITTNSFVKTGNTIIGSCYMFPTGSYGTVSAYDAGLYQISVINGLLNTANGTNGFIKYGLTGVKEFAGPVFAQPGGEILQTGGEASSGNFLIKYIVSAVGISELNEEDYKLFPNPANETISIDYRDSDLAELEITDFAGRLIMKTAIYNGINTVKTASFPTGCYLVKITNEEGISGYSKISIVH